MVSVEICIHGTSFCGNARESQIVNNEEGDDTRYVVYESDDFDSEVVDYISSEEFCDILKEKILEAENE